MLGVKGLLAKWTVILTVLAGVSVLVAYSVVDNKHAHALSSELDLVKIFHSESVNNILNQRLEQLTLVAEEVYILSNLQNKSIETVAPTLRDLWPKLELTFSLSTLVLKQGDDILKLGNLNDSVIDAMYQKTMSTFRPQAKFVCRPICSLVSIIPVRLDGKQATLLLASDISNTIQSIKAITGSDIAVLINAQTIEPRQTAYAVGNRRYIADVITSAQINRPLLDSIYAESGFEHVLSKGNIKSYENSEKYIWGQIVSNETDDLSLIFIKNVNQLIGKQAAQKASLLTIIASISVGILLTISAVSYRPLARLGKLKRTISLIGKKDYKAALKELGRVNETKASDEIQALEREFSLSISHLIEYEKQLQISQRRLTKMATIDVTTKLLNRNAFLENMSRIEDQLVENKTTLMFMDLDGFKNVNDNLGHVVGDLLLEKVGARLNKMSDTYTKVYRIGGDEFLVCLEMGCQHQSIDKICDTLLQIFDNAFAIDKHFISVSSSIGVATASETAVTYVELLKQADIAMYQAKAEGKNRFCWFTDSMMEQINLRYIIKNEFSDALKDNQLSLVYQPIVDAKTGRLIKLEALSRWMHPQIGFISPDIFIKVLEEMTHIELLSKWLIENAAKKVTELDSCGLTDVVVSINISGAQVTNIKSIELLQSLCNQHAVSFERIELEITETSLISDFAKAKSWIQEVCNIGFRIAIDDFGTGYSSLSYLTAFPFDCVKLDRSLLIDVEDNARTRNIVESVTTMIHALGVPVVAEGIETKSHLETIKMLGCDYVQGYYFSRPLSSSDLAQQLEKYKIAREWIPA